MQNRTSRVQPSPTPGTETGAVRVQSEGQVFEGMRTPLAYTWRTAKPLPATSTTAPEQPNAKTSPIAQPVEVLSRLLAQSGVKRAEQQQLIARFVALKDADQRVLLAQVKRQLRN